MFRISKYLIFAVMFLFGCQGHNLVEGFYLPEHHADTGFKLIVHVHSKKDAWPLIPDVVTGANEVYMRKGIRITNVVIKEDLEKPTVFWLGGENSQDVLIKKAYDEDNSGIHVFVAKSIKDTNDKKRTYSGLYTRAEEYGPCYRYIVIVKDSKYTTLAHELGHMFGLSHVDEQYIFNVMSTSRNPEFQRVKHATLTPIQHNVVKRNAENFKYACIN